MPLSFWIRPLHYIIPQLQKCHGCLHTGHFLLFEVGHRHIPHAVLLHVQVPRVGAQQVDDIFVVDLHVRDAYFTHQPLLLYAMEQFLYNFWDYAWLFSIAFHREGLP